MTEIIILGGFLITHKLYFTLGGLFLGIIYYLSSKYFIATKGDLKAQRDSFKKELKEQHGSFNDIIKDIKNDHKVKELENKLALKDYVTWDKMTKTITQLGKDLKELIRAEIKGAV